MTTHVAGGQGRAELPGRHEQRVVPRRDEAGHADRLAADEAREALHVLAGRTALQDPRAAGEEPEVVGDDRDLLGHGERVDLADVLGLDPAELLAVLLDEVGQLQQGASCAPSAWRRTRPPRTPSSPRPRPGRRPRPWPSATSAMTSPGGRVQTGWVSPLDESTHSPADEHLAPLHRRGHGPSSSRPPAITFRLSPVRRILVALIGRTTHRATARLYAPGQPARAGLIRLARGEHVPRTQRQEELHPVARRGEIPARSAPPPCASGSAAYAGARQIRSAAASQRALRSRNARSDGIRSPPCARRSRRAAPGRCPRTCAAPRGPAARAAAGRCRGRRTPPAAALGPADLEGVARLAHALPELPRTAAAHRPRPSTDDRRPGRHLSPESGEEARPVRLDHRPAQRRPAARRGTGPGHGASTSSHGRGQLGWRPSPARRHHGERAARGRSPTARATLRACVGRRGSPERSVEHVALQPALRLGHGPGLRELEGEQRERVAGHDAVELREGFLLPHARG